MWSPEVSLRFWAEGRAEWSLSTCPPCRGFCCLFAALQTRDPCPRCWEGERFPWDTEPQVGGENTCQAPSPGLPTWTGFLVALGAIPWADQHCWELVQLPHFSGHLSAHRVKLPMARPPALHVQSSRMGLAQAVAIKMKGRLGKKMIIIKNHLFFPFKIAARQAHST